MLNLVYSIFSESVRKQIMWLIASLYKFSFKSHQEWTELLTFINELILSNSSEQHLVSCDVSSFSPKMR